MLTTQTTLFTLGFRSIPGHRPLLNLKCLFQQNIEQNKPKPSTGHRTFFVLWM